MCLLTVSSGPMQELTDSQAERPALNTNFVVDQTPSQALATVSSLFLLAPQNSQDRHGDVLLHSGCYRATFSGHGCSLSKPERAF